MEVRACVGGTNASDRLYRDGKKEACVVWGIVWLGGSFRIGKWCVCGGGL